MMRRFTTLTVVAVALTVIAPRAQQRLVPVSELRGAPAFELMLRKLDTVGNFMMTAAHPDDENNGMLAHFAHGKGYRTSLVTATHGEGGQNEIGPELFEALAVLRTEELLAAHRFDGAEQYFLRAIDFGYSFSIEETLAKWGHREILGDFVRMIRTIRPDVIVGFVFDGEGGGQHHQTSARLTLEAFRAAADANAYPEQIKEGLRPWQAKKFYYTAGFGGPGGRGGRGGAPGAPPFAGEGAPTALAFTAGNEYDSVLGRTYDEIGGEARSMHKCQGMSQLLPLPQTGGAERYYRLRDTVLPDGVARKERAIFDGVDTRLVSLAGYAGDKPPGLLTNGLERIAITVADARTALSAGGSGAAVPSLVRGLAAVRELRSSLATMGLGDDARYEIDFRLQAKERQFQDALLVAADVRLEALAGDGLVVAGEPVPVNLAVSRRSSAVVGAVKALTVSGLDQVGSPCHGTAEPSSGPSVTTCSFSARVPADARLTAAHFTKGTEGERYVFDADVPFGLPFRPTPFTATFALNLGGADVTATIPLHYRSEADVFAGEKRHEIHVVPKFAVSVSPPIVVVAERSARTASQAAASAREVRVTVTNHAKGAATAQVSLQLPDGWRAKPATAPVAFTREDEQRTVRFTLQAPPTAAAGDVRIRAVVRDDGGTFDRGYQVIEYPHTTRRHVLREPSLTVKTLDVRVAPNVTVGYVMGVGDEIPPALEQLGARVELLTADDLAWGDLSRYTVIMTGVRAYERRADLRASNQRLIDYARAGGTVIVNYNKFEFNDAQYGPYPARVGRDRVTDENAVVRVLDPQHPVFHTPNRITEADWKGWVQERGLYFLDAAGRDPQFTDLLELEDPFPYNKGAKRGALVEARVGQGRWMYVGLGLWRQLPAGADGAYRLMANIVSLGARSGSESRPR